MDADELAGFRHLVRLPSDGRGLAEAVKRFAAAGRSDLFPELLRIAMRFGLVRVALDLRARLGLPERDADFDRWFDAHGALWFDIYVEDDLAYVETEDIALLWELLPDWPALVADAETDPNVSPMRLALLRKFAAGQDPTVAAAAPRRADVDARFRAHCEDRDIAILRTFQGGMDGLNRRSWVYLAIDEDGLAKVFKELPRDEDNRFGRAQAEPEIYGRLGLQPELPRFYGTIDLGDGLVFAKLSVCYGQTLSDYVWEGNLLSADEACLVVGRLAAMLARTHEAGVLYLDLRPENVTIEPEAVHLFDFNASRFAEDGGIDTCSFDPRYAAPETSLGFRATAATDVFQLGVLSHQLLTGKLPFSGQHPIPEDRGEALERFALPNALEPYVHRLDVTRGDARLAIVVRMLDKDPARRPTMSEVAEAFAPKAAPAPIRQKSHRVPKAWERNAVIFPARMGIPHRGHIDYLARLLGLGFHPIISLARSYTLTERDPLPKWLVMKMVAQSLFDRGFSPDDFRFILTPYYETPEELGMHYTMMPGREEAVAVASSNPGVRELFPGLPILDQRVVFGHEGEIYEVRSWGETLRRAVREGDRPTFEAYAASGVERIVPFDALRERPEPAVEFLRGPVRAALEGPDGAPIAEGRVRRYGSPEDALARLLRERGETIGFIDRFSRDTAINRDGRPALLRYMRTETRGEGLRIVYALLPS